MPLTPGGRYRARIGPSEDGPNACHDLLGRERLRHVIVGTQLQPDDAIALLTLGCDQDDGRGLQGPCTHPAQYLEAVHAGKHQIQEHERGRFSLQRCHRLPPVGRRPDEESVALEVARQDLSHHGLVVHHEHALAVHPLMMGHGCCESLS